MDDGLPIVFFASVPGDIVTSKVIHDNRDALKAVEHLIQNGYSRIAHIAGPKGLSFTQERLDGYIAETSILKS